MWLSESERPDPVGTIETVQEAIELTIGSNAFQHFALPPRDASISAFRQPPFGVFYRGQPSAAYRLEPAVFRGEQQGNEILHYDETSIFQHAQLRASAHERDFRTTFDWLAHMQHYGVPTRLLDWSESLLVALFFAVGSRRDASDGALFTINGYSLNQLTRRVKHGISTPRSLDVVLRSQMAVSRNLPRWARGLRLLSKEHLGAHGEYEVETIADEVNESPMDEATSCATPVLVFPLRTGTRMTFQAAAFTIHGGKRYAPPGDTPDTLEPAPLLPAPIGLWELQKGTGTEFLRWYSIPARAKHQIARQLLWLGIHAGTLFPELDRQALYLRQQWAGRM